MKMGMNMTTSMTTSPTTTSMPTTASSAMDMSAMMGGSEKSNHAIHPEALFVKKTEA